MRAFVALDLPAQARQALAAAIQRLRAAVPRGVRWVDPGGIHLTLKFLAALEAQQTADVLAAVDRAARGTTPFQLQLDSLGAFPSGTEHSNTRQPRVLWAGVAGDLAPLRSLQERVEREVSTLGLPQERRDFSPHLTLGRVREDAPRPLRAQIIVALETAALEPGAPWPVTAVHLVRSTLTPNGPVYTPLGSVSLLGEGGPAQP